MRIIVLGSGVTALAVARNVAIHHLCPVVADTVRGLAMRSRYVESVELPSKEEDVVLKLDCLGGGINILIATTDRWLRFLMKHRDRLDPCYKAIWHPDNAALEVCLDKASFAFWCDSRGLPIPKQYEVSEDCNYDDLPYPLLLRPRCSRHGQLLLPKAIEVRDACEMEQWLTRYCEVGEQPLVTQSLLSEGLEQYSVCVVRWRGRTLSYVTHKIRPQAEDCSVGTLVALTRNEAVEALGMRTLALLDYEGIAEVEILYSPERKRAHLIEINPRPWQQFALSSATGHDFVGALLGKKSESHVEGGVKVWLDFWGDLYNCFSSSSGMVRRRHITMREYLGSLFHANVYAVWSLADPAPAWYISQDMLFDWLSRRTANRGDGA